MSFPNIPDINPTININSTQCVAMLLASVALENLGLSHIVNAEAEKVQYALGTLEGHPLPTPLSPEQIQAVTDSASATMREVFQYKILLGMKLQDIKRIYGWNVFLNIATVTADYDGGAVTASDRAYYHTQGGAAL